MLPVQPALISARACMGLPFLAPDFYATVKKIAAPMITSTITYNATENMSSVCATFERFNCCFWAIGYG